jgi:hypothetical protein
MSRARKTTTFMVALVVALAGAWLLDWWLVSDGPGTGQLLVNRVWLERIPRDDRDMIQQLLVLRQGQHQVGAVARASAWRAVLDGFVWQLEEDRRLVTTFPQDGRKANFAVRAWACQGQAPEPFELCLEVARGTRSKRLYSRKDWIIRPDGGSRDHPEIGWLAPVWEMATHVPDRAPIRAAEAPPDWLPLD